MGTAPGTVDGLRVLVTGGSRGLGLGIVEALVARGAKVTVVARDRGRLEALSARHGVATIAGDVTSREVAATVLRDVRPNVLVLNAGAPQPLAPLDEQTWETFSDTWNTDVKAGLYWCQEALLQPLAPGSRVLVMSSGAAAGGSPLSGGYAGAKRMLWIMADYANDVAATRQLGIRFQAIVPLQMIGETERGSAAAEAYAKRKGVSKEAFLAGFGKSMPPRDVGEHVVSILTIAEYATATPLGLKGDTGITRLGAP